MISIREEREDCNGNIYIYNTIKVEYLLINHTKVHIVCEMYSNKYAFDRSFKICYQSITKGMTE